MHPINILIISSDPTCKDNGDDGENGNKEDDDGEDDDENLDKCDRQKQERQRPIILLQNHQSSLEIEH